MPLSCCIVLHEHPVLQDLPRIHGKIVIRNGIFVIRGNWRPIRKILEFETLRDLLRRACGLLGNIRQSLPVAYEGHLGRGRRGSAATPSPHRPLGRPLPAGMRGWSGLYFCKRSSGAGSRSRAFMRRRGDRPVSSSASAAKRRKACSLVSRGGRRQKLNWRWASAFSPRLQRSEVLPNQPFDLKRNMNKNASQSRAICRNVPSQIAKLLVAAQQF